MSIRMAFDCDGVIADLDSALADIATRLFGEAPEPTRADGAPPAGPKARATSGTEGTQDAEPLAGPKTGATSAATPIATATAAAPATDDGPTAEEEEVEPPRYRTLTRRQQHDLWEAVRNTENFWESLNETEPGVIARLAQIAKERRWEVIFITERPSSAGDITQLQTQRWLIKHGYDLPNVYVIKGTRGKVADALSLEIVVDDRPENCLDVKLESRARAILIWGGDVATIPPNARRLGIEPVPGMGACLDLLTSETASQPGLLKRIKQFIGA